MKQLRSVLCLLLAAAMMLPAGCGKKDEATASQETTAAAQTAEDAEEEDDDDDDDAPIKDVKVKSASKSDAKSETTESAPSTTAASTSTTAKAASTTAATAKSAGNAASGGNAAAAEAPAATEAATEAAAEAPTEALTDPAPEETEAGEEQNVVSGIIDLGSGAFEGEGITINGGTVLITGGGTYILSGARTGNVEINTTEKVKLKLNGVDITNPDGPALLVSDAKKVTLTLIEGTYNALNSGGSMHDGTITSNDTLEIKGAGTLNVTSNEVHGISSDDDIVIKNGDITVNAAKSALIANDDITVSGGTIHATGATNGIKSKGTMTISGGAVYAFGGPKETKSALFCGSVFTLTGGYVYAVGCGASEPDPSLSTQHAICVKYTPSLDAGSTVSLVVNGMEFLRETSPYACNTVFLSTPDIVDGMAYDVYAHDVKYGETNYTAGISSTAVVSAE